MSRTAFSLRPARLSDRPRMEILRLAANSNATSAESEGNWFERWVIRQGKDPRWGCFLLAEVNGRVEGYGLVGWWSPDLVDAAPKNAIPAGYILMGTWVEPAYRRQGIGMALAQERIDWIRLRSREAWYWTGDENTASQKLHERLGFEVYSDHFWFPPRDRLNSRLYRLYWPEQAHRIPEAPTALPPGPQSSG